jgi:hypothetical protein
VREGDDLDELGPLTVDHVEREPAYQKSTKLAAGPSANDVSNLRVVRNQLERVLDLRPKLVPEPTALLFVP